MAFFGVFDGHSGRHAAEFAKVNLPFNVLRNPNFDTQKLLKQDSDVITDGYVKTDCDFLAVAEKDDYKSGTSSPLPSTLFFVLFQLFSLSSLPCSFDANLHWQLAKLGTTAVTLLLTDSHMIVSNVGDSEVSIRPFIIPINFFFFFKYLGYIYIYTYIFGCFLLYLLLYFFISLFLFVVVVCLYFKIGSFESWRAGGATFYSPQAAQ